MKYLGMINLMLSLTPKGYKQKKVIRFKATKVENKKFEVLKDEVLDTTELKTFNNIIKALETDVKENIEGLEAYVTLNNIQSKNISKLLFSVKDDAFIVSYKLFSKAILKKQNKIEPLEEKTI